MNGNGDGDGDGDGEDGGVGDGSEVRHGGEDAIGDASMRMIIVVVVCDEKLWESKLKRVAEGKW